MFEAASFSLPSLFVFHSLVRGGEGVKKSSDLEMPSNEGPKDVGPTWAGVTRNKLMESFFEPRESGFAETCSVASKELVGPGLPCYWTTANSGSCASSSWRTAKIFFFFGRGISSRGE